MANDLNRPAPGAGAEQQAERYLQRRGLAPVARNYRCKVGEIDLIMSDGDLLVFIEVRQRNNRFFGSAIESVDPYKQRKLIRAARHYLQKHHLAEKVACRFDVVGVEPFSTQADGAPRKQECHETRLTWICDAFRLD